MIVRLSALVFFLYILHTVAQADTASFDLAGPPIEVRVDRNGTKLPISEVANLHRGDRLWIHPQMPDHQSAHYLLIVTFLRGSTNPPPEKWFTRAETWSKKVREEGVFVTVPAEAQQALVFLAPETGGDFSTLRSAVRGRPGSFVRAAQDLDQASLDRARLDTYLEAIRKVSESDPSRIKDVSVLLARSLSIRLDDDCLKKPVDEQATCLTQKGGDMVLNDGHSQSVVGALINGAPSDLIGQLSYTPQASYGYFSPYVGAVMDLARILDSLHTAQYQYIPALSFPKGDELELKLNNPPSFHNPKSVIVIALPAVKQEKAPPLRPANAPLACFHENVLVLATEGAPLVFSTELAHDMVLHVESMSGRAVDLPVKADAARGGFVVDPNTTLESAKLDVGSGETLKGTLRGSWGFEPFSGPTFQLRQPSEAKWTIPPAETAGLMAGIAHTLHLKSAAAACVDQVSLKDERGADLKSQWKLSKEDEVEVAIPVESAKSGGRLSLRVKLAGVSEEEHISLRLYGEPAQLKLFTIIPGDARGILHGTHLDDVESVELSGTHFTRLIAGASAKTAGAAEELQLAAAGASATASLQPSEKLTARAKLKDGRSLDVPASIESPRPRVTLLNKSVELGAGSISSAIHLANEGELPQDGRLSFSIKTEMPAAFPRDEKVEVATADYSFHAMLSIDDGGLTLQDAQTIVGRFDPARSFGGSAFGPLRFRPVDGRGVDGDWETLATLVREPSLKELHCPNDVALQCILKGSNLFLLDAVAADPQFSTAASVPEGFIAATLNVPRPVSGTLYIKLRDDPSDVNTVSLPIMTDQTPAGEPMLPPSPQQEPSLYGPNVSGSRPHWPLVMSIASPIGPPRRIVYLWNVGHSGFRLESLARENFGLPISSDGCAWEKVRIGRCVIG
jgi:hypothetical protein